MIPTKLSWLYVATHIHKTFPEEQLHNKQQDNIFTSLAHVAVDIHNTYWHVGPDSQGPCTIDMLHQLYFALFSHLLQGA